MTKQSPKARLSDRVPTQLVIYQAVCVLVAVAIASFFSLEVAKSALAGGLAIAIPNALLACVMGMVQSPLKIVTLMLAKLALSGVCLAVAIIWYVTSPLPFFITAVVVMILPSLLTYMAQSSDKPLVKGLR